MAKGDKSLRAVLWDNVSALMLKKYGGENLQRLARDAKIGPGSASRIKEARTSVGLDIVDKIAKAFGLEAYQLLCPVTSQESFIMLCEAYISTDERGRLLLSATAEAILRAAGRDVAGKAHG